MEILPFIYMLSKLNIARRHSNISVRYSFCKQTNKVPPPSSPSIIHKICQIWFSCKGRKPQNKKTKGVTENQRSVRLCGAESRNPGFLNNKSSVPTPSGVLLISCRISRRKVFSDTMKYLLARCCWSRVRQSFQRWKYSCATRLQGLRKSILNIARNVYSILIYTYLSGVTSYWDCHTSFILVSLFTN